MTTSASIRHRSFTHRFALDQIEEAFDYISIGKYRIRALCTRSPARRGPPSGVAAIMHSTTGFVVYPRRRAALTPSRIASRIASVCRLSIAV